MGRMGAERGPPGPKGTAIVRNAREAAEYLTRSFRLRYGELTLKVVDGEVTIIQRLDSHKGKDLEAFVA